MVKLSDLMRQGRKVHRQAFVDFTSVGVDGANYTCNLTAAYVAAIGFTDPESAPDVHEFKQIIPTLENETGISLQQYVPVPTSEYAHTVYADTGRLWRVIADLNDNSKWTADQTADWLDSIPLK
jgi:hypothetical protein